MNIALFTGGNGNSNLIKHLKDLPFVNLSLLINGYDDGLSTGVIRSANYGMLGPSDFRKNFTYILDDFSDSNKIIRNLFEHRLSLDEATLLIKSYSELIQKLIIRYPLLKQSDLNFVLKYFDLGASNLLNYTTSIDQLSGFSVGNLLIGGIYAETNNFNKALNILTDNFEITAKLINVSTDDNSKLVAFDKFDNILFNEADIVNYNGSYPLSDFYMISLDKLEELDFNFKYRKEDIHKVSNVPQISIEAKNALNSADIIIFGSGTQFSSLLPSYRICSNYILASNASKILIVNNKYDSDINNINFEDFSNLILRELKQTEISYFKSIIIDKSSLIQPNEIYSNVVLAPVSNVDGKHNGTSLWTWINKSLALENGKTPVLVNLADNADINLLSAYQTEIDIFNSDSNRKLKLYLNNYQGENLNYTLFLDATGKVSLNELEIWIDIMEGNNLDAIIGSRFDSRRQLIHSYKFTLVESTLTYIFALITSHFVSLVYYIRFIKIIPDPLSGIYLVKQPGINFKYSSLSNLLKHINTIEKVEYCSLPISYRTFNSVKIWLKLRNVLVNLLRLYV